MKCPSDPVIARLHATNMHNDFDVDFGHLAEVGFVPFLCCTVTLSPHISIPSSLEGRYLAQLTQKK